MQHVSTRAGKVAVDRQGAGLPVFLLHSVGHDRHDFDFVLPRLAEQFQTIAIDWPGHGESDMPAEAGTGLMCDVLEDVVDALDVGPAAFVGNSLGGTASLRLAARHPERVRALVLVDTGGTAEVGPLLSTLCWIQGREFVRRWTGQAFARAYLRVEGPNRDAVLARMVEQRKRPGFVKMDAAMWRSFGRPENDMRSEAPNVRAPTLVVWGTRDPVIRAKVEGKRCHELVPNSEYVELDTGHIPFVERPQEFLNVVMPFLWSALPS